MVCLPLDSAGHDGVQPAAESRHVQRHIHGEHVLGAAPRMPLRSTHQSGLPCTLLGLLLPRPLVSWPSISPSWCAPLWTRQLATAFNQHLSFDTSKVTAMSYMFRVRSTRALTPTALSRSLPPFCCLRCRHPKRPHASRAAPLPASHMPAFRLGSPRRRSTSRSASTRPVSRIWTRCSTCALRVP